MTKVYIALAALFAAALALPARAEPAFMVSYIEVVPQKVDDAIRVLRTYRDLARSEAGAVSIDALRRAGRPNHFALLETWQSEAARDTHAASPAAKTLRDALAPLLSAPFDERPHAALSIGPKATLPPTALLAVTHVDIVPTQKDVGVALVRDLAEAERKAQGAIRFDALTQISRPNHMTIVETWDSQASQEAHLVSAPVRAFRARLIDLSGSLYDERLYHPLP